jgi:transcriptional regulator with XRE-family HTH domain
MESARGIRDGNGKATAEGVKDQAMPERLNPDWAVVGQRLREIELAEGLGGRQIAEALGITEVNWSRYKTGTRELPIPVAGELRRLYGCALDWIYLGEEYYNAEGFRRRLAEARRKVALGMGVKAPSRGRRSIGDGPSRF